MERAGGCVCGAARYVATLKSDKLGACHCGTCRKWAGGPYVTTRTRDVKFSQDDTVRTFTSSQWAERGFCSRCGSCLFYRITAPGPGKGETYLAAGTLDDLTGLTLTHEVFTDKRPDAYCFAGDLSGMTEAEVFAQFAPPTDG